MQRYESNSDEELVGFVSSDDKKAFEEIYNRYWSALYSNAYKRLRDYESSREIVQDVFTDLWVHRADRQIHTSVAAYLHTAVRYRTLNQIQKEWIRLKYRSEVQLQTPEENNATEETIFLTELSARLEEVILELPPQCKRVFELSRKAYKNNREIASELNISEKTVENHLTKALRTLRLNLGDLASLLMIAYLN